MEITNSNYIKTYKVAECAGITNTDMTDGANRLDICTKIKNWVNGNSELNKIFTAEVLTKNESNQWYCVELKTSVGFGTCYGTTHQNMSRYNSIFYSYHSGSSHNVFSEISTDCAVENLLLIVANGSYGTVFGFACNTSGQSADKMIKGLVTTCKDDFENEHELGVYMYSKDLTFIKDETTNGISNGSDILSGTSISTFTALFPFMVPDTDYFSEYCRIADGRRFYGLTCFEAEDKVWCSIFGSNYKGIALRLE